MTGLPVASSAGQGEVPVAVVAATVAEVSQAGSWWTEAPPIWLVAIGIGIAIIALVITAISITFKVGKWVGGMNTSLTHLGNNLEKFENAIKEGFSEIREDIKKILSWQSSKTIEAKSPLNLTTIGKDVSKTLGMSSVADKLAPELARHISGKSPYDIQQFCFDYVRDEYEPDPEFDNRIKQHAYQNGLDRDEVLDVLAIELRDRLLKMDQHQHKSRPG